MLASEFINTMVYGILNGGNGNLQGMEQKYNRNFFFLPRIYCKDGFNISVQVHNSNYCASENGYRTFGLNWERVEWGFPSQEIDGEKFNAEEKDNTTESVGSVEIALIDELCEQHNGIDLSATLSNGVYSNE